MKQQSFAAQGAFEKYRRKSRRELLLDQMEAVLPWSALESLVRPHMRRPGTGGSQWVFDHAQDCCFSNYVANIY